MISWEILAITGIILVMLAGLRCYTNRWKAPTPKWVTDHINQIENQWKEGRKGKDHYYIITDGPGPEEMKRHALTGGAGGIVFTFSQILAVGARGEPIKIHIFPLRVYIDRRYNGYIAENPVEHVQYDPLSRSGIMIYTM